jgi:hypothetical protein
MKRAARWLLLPLLARGLASEIERLAGADGLIELGGADPADAVCRLLGAHRSEAGAVKKHLDALIEGGHLVLDGDGGLQVPRVDSRSPGALRQAKWRERRRGDVSEALRRDATETLRGDESETLRETSHSNVTRSPSREIQDPGSVLNLHVSGSASAPFSADFKTTDPETAGAREASPKPPRRVACPAGNDGLAAFLARWKLPAQDPEFVAFLDHHRAKRSLFADWSAAWRTWQRNAVRFGRGPAPSVPRRGLQLPAPRGQEAFTEQTGTEFFDELSKP